VEAVNSENRNRTRLTAEWAPACRDQWLRSLVASLGVVLLAMVAACGTSTARRRRRRRS
jgi:uncharacterized protein (DUF2062 family)